MGWGKMERAISARAGCIREQKPRKVRIQGAAKGCFRAFVTLCYALCYAANPYRIKDVTDVTDVTRNSHTYPYTHTHIYPSPY